MTWMALVPPRLGTADYPGMCLRFSQSFFGAPVKYRSAWEAWQHQQYRHPTTDPLPNVPVLLWFSHWGTYGDPLSYENWGHVTPYVPGDGIYSSPANPYAGWSQSKFSTIAEVERAYNCTYVGWSEDINGLRVAQNVDVDPVPAKPAKKRKANPMFVIYFKDVYPGSKTPGRWAFTGSKYWKEIGDQRTANILATQLGVTNAYVCPSRAAWDNFKKASK